MEPEALYVSIDVAKTQVDVAVRPTDDRWAITRAGAGIRKLVARLQTLAPALVVLEASGGLEVPLVAALATRRHQVRTMVVVERNRLGTATSAVRPHIEAHIAWLTQQLADLDRQLRRRSGRVRCGARRTTCCAASPAWVPNSRSPQWRDYTPSSGSSTRSVRVSTLPPGPGRSKLSYARQSGRAWTRSPSTWANSRCRQRTWAWMRRYTRRRGGHANWCRAAVSCWTGWRRRVTTPASLRSWWPPGQTG